LIATITIQVKKDPSGRLIIPSSVLKNLQLEKYTEFILEQKDEKLILVPVKPELSKRVETPEVDFLALVREIRKQHARVATNKVSTQARKRLNQLRIKLRGKLPFKTADEAIKRSRNRFHDLY